MPFSESGVSAFQATLIESFERATKQLRVIARADVAADVKQLEHRIIEVLLSE
ncbi:MAG: hypothetical protein RML35_05020 [Chloroherpetonaceae bacterium]|nr:hypothetical protein [Chloroherpetonaceae bacterium]